MIERQSRAAKARQELMRDIVSSGMKIGSVLPCAHEIARKYGVSYVTARRVTSSLVDEGILEREPGRMARLAAIPALDDLDRAPKRRKTGNVFVFTHSVVIKDPDGYTAGVFNAVEGLLRGQGLVPMHRMLRHYTDVPALVREEVRATKVDGIISCCIHNEDQLRLFADTGLPVVSIDHTPKNCTVDSIVTNNWAIVRSAVGHLLELGHRRIDYFGHFHNYPVRDFDSEEMEFYWRKMLESVGATGRAHFVDDSELGEAVDRMVEGPDAATAAFCSSSVAAVAVQKILRSMKISVPRDFSIVTQGDGATKEHRITTVDINWYEIARTAVQRMADLVRGECPPGSRLTHSGKLLNRGSTAPAL